MRVINKPAIDFILNRLSDLVPVNHYDFSSHRYFLPGFFRLENICINFLSDKKTYTSVYFNEYITPESSHSTMVPTSLESVYLLLGCNMNQCSDIGNYFVRVDPSFSSTSPWNEQFRLIFFDRWQATPQQRLERIKQVLSFSKCNYAYVNHLCNKLSKMIKNNYVSESSPIFLYGIYGKLSKPLDFGIKIYFATKYLTPFHNNVCEKIVTSWRNGESLINEFCKQSEIDPKYLIIINSEIIKFCPENRMSFWGVNVSPEKEKDIKIYYLLPNTPQRNYFPLLQCILPHWNAYDLRKILSFFAEQHFCLRYIAVSVNSKNPVIKTYFFPTIQSIVATC